MARRVANLLALAAAAAAKCEVLRSLEFQQNRERRHGARKPDAAAPGAQGRLLPVPRAGRLGEGAVPVAVRFADDLRLKLSPDAFAAYLRLLAHASRRTPPPRRDQL